MNLLLDTNVLSEVKRPVPNVSVLAFLDNLDEDRVFLSIASIAELQHGVALTSAGRRREALAAWLAYELPQRFADRILAIDQAIAMRWGDLMAISRRNGIPLSAMDGFFAATALAHDLTIVTRNSKDFAPFGVNLLDPWNAESS